MLYAGQGVVRQIAPGHQISLRSEAAGIKKFHNIYYANRDVPRKAVKLPYVIVEIFRSSAKTMAEVSRDCRP